MKVHPTSRARKTPIDLVSLACLALAASGCGSEASEPRVAVGFMTDMAIGFDFDFIERSFSVNGSVTLAEHIEFGQTELLFPTEVFFPRLADGDEVAVSVEAYHYDEPAVVLSRRASTEAVGGRSLLLPFSLDAACSGVSCPASSTCVAGACVDPFLDPASLSDHAPMWVDGAKDACKMPPAPSPFIEIGQGQTEYADLADEQIVTLEPGPQGGHHVWLALRVEGLRQMGSIVTVKGRLPEIPYDVPAFSTQIALRKAGQNQCEARGLRFQVDRGISLAEVLGKTLDLEVVLKDPSGDYAEAKKRVIIAP